MANFASSEPQNSSDDESYELIGDDVDVQLSTGSSASSIVAGAQAVSLPAAPFATDAAKNDGNSDVCVHCSHKSDVDRTMMHDSFNHQIQKLAHAWMCEQVNCEREDCIKLQKEVAHSEVCKSEAGTCIVCVQLFELWSYHGLHCKKDGCLMPFCMRIRNSEGYVFCPSDSTSALKNAPGKKREFSLPSLLFSNDISLSLTEDQLSKITAAADATQVVSTASSDSHSNVKRHDWALPSILFSNDIPADEFECFNEVSEEEASEDAEDVAVAVPSAAASKAVLPDRVEREQQQLVNDAETTLDVVAEDKRQPMEKEKKDLDDSESIETLRSAVDKLEKERRQLRMIVEEKTVEDLWNGLGVRDHSSEEIEAHHLPSMIKDEINRIDASSGCSDQAQEKRPSLIGQSEMMTRDQQLPLLPYVAEIRANLKEVENEDNLIAITYLRLEAEIDIIYGELKSLDLEKRSNETIMRKAMADHRELMKMKEQFQEKAMKLDEEQLKDELKLAKKQMLETKGQQGKNVQETQKEQNHPKEEMKEMHEEKEKKEQKPMGTFCKMIEEQREYQNQLKSVATAATIAIVLFSLLP